MINHAQQINNPNNTLDMFNAKEASTESSSNSNNNPSYYIISEPWEV